MPVAAEKLLSEKGYVPWTEMWLLLVLDYMLHNVMAQEYGNRGKKIVRRTNKKHGKPVSFT